MKYVGKGGISTDGNIEILSLFYLFKENNGRGRIVWLKIGARGLNWDDL
jgi:hypothetical protein